MTKHYGIDISEQHNTKTSAEPRLYFHLGPTIIFLQTTQTLIEKIYNPNEILKSSADLSQASCARPILLAFLPIHLIFLIKAQGEKRKRNKKQRGKDMTIPREL